MFLGIYGPRERAETPSLPRFMIGAERKEFIIEGGLGLHYHGPCTSPLQGTETMETRLQGPLLSQGPCIISSLYKKWHCSTQCQKTGKHVAGVFLSCYSCRLTQPFSLFLRSPSCPYFPNSAYRAGRIWDRRVNSIISCMDMAKAP